MKIWLKYYSILAASVISNSDFRCIQKWAAWNLAFILPIMSFFVKASYSCSSPSCQRFVHLLNLKWYELLGDESAVEKFKVIVVTKWLSIQSDHAACFWGGGYRVSFHSIMGPVYKSWIDLKFEVQLTALSLFSMLNFHSLLPLLRLCRVSTQARQS